MTYKELTYVMEFWVAYERLYPDSYWTPMNLLITDTASLAALLQACAIVARSV